MSLLRRHVIEERVLACLEMARDHDPNSQGWRGFDDLLTVAGRGQQYVSSARMVDVLHAMERKGLVETRVFAGSLGEAWRIPAAA